MRKSFLIYVEMRKYLTIYEEPVSHIWLCNCSILNFLIYEENFSLFLMYVTEIQRSSWHLLWLVGGAHKVHIYLGCHSDCPLVRIGTPPPTPFPASKCAPPPGTKGEGTHSPAGEGVGPNSDDWRKNHSTLSTLWCFFSMHSALSTLWCCIFWYV